MNKRRIIIYVALSLLVGIILGGIMSEAAYRIQTRSDGGASRQITLVIPPGTANLVKNGQPSPSIPGDMVFVVGDTLVVKNEDSSDHQLGPFFIPKGTSATVTFNQVANLAYACTFSPEKYLGLEVKAPLTVYTRAIGILDSGIPLGILIALYVVFAIRPELAKKAGKNDCEITKP
jgi:hypothetical protein